MHVILILISLGLAIASLVGLARPSLVWPASRKPGRLKAFIAYSLLSFLAFAGFAVAIPAEEQAKLAQQRAERSAAAAAEADAHRAEQQRAASEKEAAAQAAARAAAEQSAAAAKAREIAEAAERGRGLGVGRIPALLVFQDKYHIKPAEKVSGLERWMGNSGLGIVELIGRENDLTSLTVMIGVASDDPTGNLSRLADQHAALKLVFPKWSGSKDWLLSAFTKLPKEPKQEVARDGLHVTLSHLQGMGMVMLVIDSRNKQNL